MFKSINYYQKQNKITKNQFYMNIYIKYNRYISFSKIKTKKLENDIF